MHISICLKRGFYDNKKISIIGLLIFSSNVFFASDSNDFKKYVGFAVSRLREQSSASHVARAAYIFARSINSPCQEPSFEGVTDPRNYGKYARRCYDQTLDNMQRHILENEASLGYVYSDLQTLLGLAGAQLSDDRLAGRVYNSDSYGIEQ